MTLIRTRNLIEADDVYEKLVALHAGRSLEDSVRVDARLIITLFNHIGDAGVILEAIALADGKSADPAGDASVSEK